MGSPAKKMPKSEWFRFMYEKVANAQYDLIKGKYNQVCAKQANYGWGDASNPTRISIATKVYASKTKVLQSEAHYPSLEITHEWQDY